MYDPVRTFDRVDVCTKFPKLGDGKQKFRITLGSLILTRFAFFIILSLFSRLSPTSLEFQISILFSFSVSTSK